MLDVPSSSSFGLDKQTKLLMPQYELMANSAGSSMGYEHPEERPRKLYDASSIDYYVAPVQGYFLDARLERGSQKRPWNIGLGAAGKCSESMIYDVRCGSYGTTCYMG
jgi:hypothetical protein